MTTATLERERLSQAVRDLPDSQVVMVLNFIEDLYDDEPLTGEDIADSDNAEAEIAAGNFYTLEEFDRIMDEMDDLP
ncbi:hypothetical protein FACS1894216_06580 [Synergistales bacterium]|nr:hypothetical protein FACS1894216_06580 [Synergistales bacterium]